MGTCVGAGGLGWGCFWVGLLCFGMVVSFLVFVNWWVLGVVLREFGSLVRNSYEAVMLLLHYVVL